MTALMKRLVLVGSVFSKHRYQAVAYVRVRCITTAGTRVDEVVGALN